MGPALSVAPFSLEAPFSFESDRSATGDCYVRINIAKQNLMSFLAVFKLYHACIRNHFENTPVK
jgi:hypothetical protein